MVTFNTRDVPDEIAAAIDLAARRVGQSRQEYVVQKFIREYGPGQNTTEVIRQRAEFVIQHLSSGSSLYLTPRPSLARISELLGYESTAPLDELRRGDRPLTFAEADRLHELFGVHRAWLLDGERSPFYMQSRYSEPGEMFRALARNELTWGDGSSYERLIFVAPLGDQGYTHVFGQRDATGYRNDLLLSNVPLWKGVGATGRGQIEDFCELAAVLWGHVYAKDPRSEYPDLAQPIEYASISYLPKSEEQFQAVVYGKVHLAVTRPELVHSHWLDDIWEFDYQGLSGAPQALRDAREIFLAHARFEGIQNNEQLFDYLADKIYKIRSHAAKKKAS